MMPTSAPSISQPQNATPAAISRSSSSGAMYGSCQRSAGITPRYASAAALTISRIAGRSSSRQGRIVLTARYCTAMTATATDLERRAAELDASDPLRALGERFVASDVAAYLDGNSLGRPPRDAPARIERF